MGVRFGVEIETHMPAGSVQAGPHGRGLQVPWLPAGWMADEDPSIIPPTSSRLKAEFVSPILDGAEGLEQLRSAVVEIKARGGQVNMSCGIHVHVDFDKSDKAAVRRLTRLVANHEKALYAVTGTLSRERGQGSRYGTNWCKSIKSYGSAGRAIRAASRDRYHLLNLATTKPTVEFRVFGSSLNPLKISAWVRLCVGLVERAMAPNPGSVPWHAPASLGGLSGAVGVGEQEVARLVFALGWSYKGFGTRKWGRQKFGAVGASDLKPSIDECLRLARKYDAAIAAGAAAAAPAPAAAP